MSDDNLETLIQEAFEEKRLHNFVRTENESPMRQIMAHAATDSTSSFDDSLQGTLDRLNNPPKLNFNLEPVLDLLGQTLSQPVIDMHQKFQQMLARIEALEASKAGLQVEDEEITVTPPNARKRKSTCSRDSGADESPTKKAKIPKMLELVDLKIKPVVVEKDNDEKKPVPESAKQAEKPAKNVEKPTTAHSEPLTSTPPPSYSASTQLTSLATPAADSAVSSIAPAGSDIPNFANIRPISNPNSQIPINPSLFQLFCLKFLNFPSDLNPTQNYQIMYTYIPNLKVLDVVLTFYRKEILDPSLHPTYVQYMAADLRHKVFAGYFKNLTPIMAADYLREKVIGMKRAMNMMGSMNMNQMAMVEPVKFIGISQS